MRVVDLGCGWGSLTLYLLERYPNMRVTSVSNSRTQKAHIEATASARGWSKRLTVHTMDANVLELEPATYDRCCSIEMFEHMKNYGALMERISRFLKPGGKLFVHIFTSRVLPYHFVKKDASDWMAEHFFTGGTMPSPDLLSKFNTHMALEDQWAVNGVHYYRTLEAWLAKQDRNEAAVRAVFAKAYGGADQATKWITRWRLFYLGSSESFGFDSGSGAGNEWFVSHYRFVKP